MRKIKMGYIHDDFDMFSIDDLRKIENASKQCEKLVVGVYSDEYYKMKNGKAPMISCKDRIKIVSAMKGVTYVVEVDNEERLAEETVKQMNETIDEIRKVKKKYKVGFVQGTFDMFHVGHYNLLFRAKELCETLIVGVNTDELVRTYKNKTPIVPYEDRIKIVDAIKLVDQTIGMEDRNKMKAARSLEFDALIMGSDWQGTEFYSIMEEELKQIGVDVVYFPYTKGISSTELRIKLNKDNNGNDIFEK